MWALGLIGKTLGGWPYLEILGVNVLGLKAKIKKEMGTLGNQNSHLQTTQVVIHQK